MENPFVSPFDYVSLALAGLGKLPPDFGVLHTIYRYRRSRIEDFMNSVVEYAHPVRIRSTFCPGPHRQGCGQRDPARLGNRLTVPFVSGSPRGTPSALFPMACEDQNALHLHLSSPGCTSRELALPVAGDKNSASRSVAALVNGLPSLRNWKIKAWTKVAADSVMHIDSTTF